MCLFLKYKVRWSVAYQKVLKKTSICLFQPFLYFWFMGLLQHLPEIEKEPLGVYVLHEKFERFMDWHQHSKGQLSYCEGGIAYIEVHQKTYVVPSHYFFWIPVGVEHVLRVSQGTTNIHSIYFGLNEVDTDPFLHNLGIYPASELVIQMIKYTEKWKDNIILPSDDRYVFMRALLQVMIPQQENTVPIILPITENDRLSKILSFLELNMDHPLSLKSVSDKFNTSERTLSRLFQAELKMSFLQYLKHLRIIHSISMLQKTHLSLSEIAEKVGYNTLGAFSNTFFELTKMRPSDMRKNFFT